MKILYAGLNPRSPMGGGELSAQFLLSVLARRHDVSVLGLGKAREGEMPGVHLEEIDAPVPSGFPWWPGPRHGERELSRRLAERTRAECPDLLLLQQPATIAAGVIPKGTRVIGFVRSALCYGLWDPTPQAWRRVLSAPSFALRRSWSLPTLRRADLIVTNSLFMVDQLLHRRGLQSVAVPPFIAAQTGKGQLDGKILHCGLDLWKGGRVANAIAARMPGRDFLFLTGSRPDPAIVAQARRLSNVEITPWTNNMPEIYGRCRLLLVPSQWEEPFGRVAVEAAGFGLPILASAVGGLPEAVGPAGVHLLPEASVDDWCSAIRSLDEPAEYDDISEKAQTHAAEFAGPMAYTVLRNAVKSKLGLDLGAWDVTDIVDRGRTS